MNTPATYGGAAWNLTAGRYVMRKLPHITALFWAIKILATTLGETLGDFVSQDLGLGTLRAAIVLLAVFAVMAVIQVRANRFHPPLFWMVVVLTSTAGTTISDYINYTRHLGQSTGVLILGTGLAVVMFIWWRSGQTFDVENLATRTAEVLFWIAVVFSNSLGTSTGDWLAAGLGTPLAAVVLTLVMLLILAAHYFTPINAMLLFWIAFILTRPWGAEMGNILSKPAPRGALNWGDGPASALLIGALVVLVAYQSVQIRRTPHGATALSVQSPYRRAAAAQRRGDHGELRASGLADRAVAAELRKPFTSTTMMTSCTPATTSGHRSARV